MGARSRDFQFSPLGSPSSSLLAQVRMLEDRLQNMEYLKQIYERSTREKTIEVEALRSENYELKSEIIEKNKIILELKGMHGKNEDMLMQMVEENRTNTNSLENELKYKCERILELEKSLQEQYGNSLRVIDENQELRKEIREKDRMYEEYVFVLEEKLRVLEEAQKHTEKKITRIISTAAGKGKKGNNVKKETFASQSKKIGKEEINNSRKRNGSNNEMSATLEVRLKNSEKRIRNIESLLASTVKNSTSSPLASVTSTENRRSSTHSLQLTPSKPE
jgi:chromosome segregation ATPase